MSTQETALPELSGALRPHGVTMTYGQLILRATSAVFPVRREKRLVYAIGDPADIAKMIKDDEEKRASKVIASVANARLHKKPGRPRKTVSKAA